MPKNWTQELSIDLYKEFYKNITLNLDDIVDSLLIFVEGGIDGQSR